MRFDSKACVVTGGANGIGRCIAESFLAEGARVAVIDTDESAGKLLAARFPRRLLFVEGDVAQEPTLATFARQVTESFGSIDCLINNACIGRHGLLSGCEYDDFNNVLRVGITAPYYLTKLLFPHFAKGASVVNISSTRAVMSQADTESYTAAKGGISALTHAMSASLAGIARVNSVSPGWINTSAYRHAAPDRTEYSTGDEAQHPVGRIGTPEDIAQTVLFLCGPDAAFITGQNITVDGGMSKLMIYHGEAGWLYRASDRDRSQC